MRHASARPLLDAACGGGCVPALNADGASNDIARAALEAARGTMEIIGALGWEGEAS